MDGNFDDLEQRKAIFLRENPHYGYGIGKGDRPKIDDWRPREFPALIHGLTHCKKNSPSNLAQPDSDRLVYVDHAGATLCPETQLADAFKLLSSSGCPPGKIVGNVFGSPHSSGPAASCTSDAVEDVRRRVLEFFGASPDEYQVIFTSGATAAMRIVADHFPWTQNEPHSSDSAKRSLNHNADDVDSHDSAAESATGTDEGVVGSIFAHTSDVHTSCLGIRGAALARGARVECLERVVTALGQQHGSGALSSSNYPAAVLSVLRSLTELTGPSKDTRSAKPPARQDEGQGLSLRRNKSLAERTQTPRTNGSGGAAEASGGSGGGGNDGGGGNGRDGSLPLISAQQLRMPGVAAGASVTLLVGAMAGGGGWRSAAFLVAASNAGLVAFILMVATLLSNSDAEEDEEENTKRRQSGGIPGDGEGGKGRGDGDDGDDKTRKKKKRGLSQKAEAKPQRPSSSAVRAKEEEWRLERERRLRGLTSYRHEEEEDDDGDHGGACTEGGGGGGGGNQEEEDDDDEEEEEEEEQKDEEEEKEEAAVRVVHHLLAYPAESNFDGVKHETELLPRELRTTATATRTTTTATQSATPPPAARSTTRLAATPATRRRRLSKERCRRSDEEESQRRQPEQQHRRRRPRRRARQAATTTTTTEHCWWTLVDAAKAVSSGSVKLAYRFDNTHREQTPQMQKQQPHRDGHHHQQGQQQQQQQQEPTVISADFVPVSFYKIFGYPTGLGCLLVSRRAARVLFQAPTTTTSTGTTSTTLGGGGGAGGGGGRGERFFGGGTLAAALTSRPWQRFRVGVLGALMTHFDALGNSWGVYRGFGGLNASSVSSEGVLSVLADMRKSVSKRDPVLPTAPADADRSRTHAEPNLSVSRQIDIRDAAQAKQ